MLIGRARGDGHIRALGGKTSGHGGPDATAGAGDQGSTPSEASGADHGQTKVDA